MNFDIKYIRRSREVFTELVNNLSEEQLNQIPEGFRNNIIWNYGHAIISTQGLCYHRSGVNPGLDIPLLEKYRKGSKPEAYISPDEIKLLKEYAVSSLDQLEKDLENGVFKTIPSPYSTATYTHIMHSIEEILACCLAHESMHIGYAMAQRKRV